MATSTTGPMDTSTGSSATDSPTTGAPATTEAPITTESPGSTGPVDGCEEACAEGLTCCDEACVDLQTDDAHCGACSRDCHDEGACIDATCHPVVVAAGQENPEGLALDATNVYWTVYGTLENKLLDGAVRRLEKSKPGGKPMDIKSPTGPGPAFIDVSDEGVFWTDVAGNGSLEKNGAPCVGPLADPRALTIDGGSVYFVSVTLLQKVSANNCVTTPGFPIAVGAENYGIALDAAYIYGSDMGPGGGIWRVPRAGGLPKHFATMGPVFEIAVEGEWACFTTYGMNSTVYASGLDFADIKPLSTGVPLANGIALVDGYCYWGTSGHVADHIARRIIDRSEAEEVLVDGDLGIQAVALDEHHLYYTAEGSKSVSRIARP